MKETIDGNFTVGTIPEFKIIVSFNDYIIKSMKDRTTEVQLGINTSWDILTGVKYVHKDKTEKEQLAISARIKLENGIETISTAEASALQNLNLANVDSLKEDKVEIIEVPITQEVVEETEVTEDKVENKDDVENVEEVLLNGAQITSAVAIVDSFNTGVLTFEGALEMLMTFLNIPKEKARKMLNNGVPTKPTEVVVED